LRHPTGEESWRRTRNQPDFDPDVLAAALAKNARANYGLTLVLGCPLPTGVLERIEAFRYRLCQIAPGFINFGRREAYHLTVYGLKRSREMPYTQDELAPVLAGLDRVLRHELGSVSEIRVRLSGSVVTASGAVLVLGQPDEALVRLRAAIGLIEGVDRLKSASSHITLGQFATPFGSARAYRRSMEEVEMLRDFPVGDLLVRELKLVSYRHRLLHDLAWQRSIRLPGGTLTASSREDR
jgi:hypothetical protein